jgi:hypothetical protein
LPDVCSSGILLLPRTWLDPTSGLTQVLGEFSSASTTYSLLGLDVIGQQSASDWSYFGYDGLGSVRQTYSSIATHK